MAKFIITGGQPLYGSVRLGGAKNASFKLMLASLLMQSESRLLNFSRISEVNLVAQAISALGGTITRRGERTLFINPQTLKTFSLPQKFGAASRSAPMFLPVLLHRFGRAEVPLPGGDQLGQRSIAWHLEALAQMGAHISQSGTTLKAVTAGLHGTTYRFPKNSHTGTETVIMAAVLAHGQTLIQNAAQEPEVDDLINFLNHAGARIRRLVSRQIAIEGVARLAGTIHQIMPDRNEAVSYACAALITRGDIIVENAQSQHLEAFLAKLNDIGAGFELGSFGIRFYYHQPLQACTVVTAPHPGFMTDWQPLWAVLATQLQGTSVIHETVHVDRFQYLDHLIKMGAKVKPFSPKIAQPEKFYNFVYTQAGKHNPAARIYGPTRLKAGKFTCRDLRHGATLVLAALAARGTSILSQVDQIDRGYEEFDQRLGSLGANIQRQAT